MADGRRVHPDCRNASNPYHECSEYCFKIIAETLPRMGIEESEPVRASSTISKPIMSLHDEDEDRNDERVDSEQDDDKDEHADGENVTEDFANLTGRKKRLFEVHLKMNEARKANQTAMIAEKKRMEAPSKSRGISKQKWIEEMKNVEDSLEEYNKMKEADPEFYLDASSLQYGKAPKTSDEKIERMVKELKDQDDKRQAFSRRKFHEEKDVDSINDRNEHFNKKIERAFGEYTLEIKNNLERGTALPD